GGELDAAIATALKDAAGNEALIAHIKQIEAVIATWRTGPAARQMTLMRHPDTVNEARAIEVTGAGEDLTHGLQEAGAKAIALLDANTAQVGAEQATALETTFLVVVLSAAVTMAASIGFFFWLSS